MVLLGGPLSHKPARCLLDGRAGPMETCTKPAARAAAANKKRVNMRSRAWIPRRRG